MFIVASILKSTSAQSRRLCQCLTFCLPKLQRGPGNPESFNPRMDVAFYNIRTTREVSGRSPTDMKFQTKHMQRKKQKNNDCKQNENNESHTTQMINHLLAMNVSPFIFVPFNHYPALLEPHVPTVLREAFHQGS